MANTFFGLTIASSGLGASGLAINTAAHNISNVNTKGYTKQQTVQEASSAIRVYTNYGTVGTGVSVTEIKQLRSSYYDTKYWNNNSVCGNYSTLESYTTLIEDYLDEFNLDGFTTEYKNLFEAVNALTKDPHSVVARNQLVNYSQSISEFFNTMTTNLNSVQRQADDEVKSTANAINTVAQEIASLNKQINTIEVNGGAANDLRDARALLIDELSGYINTTVKETEVGNGVTEFCVYVDGYSLVDGYDYNQIICTPRETGDKRNASDINGLVELSWNNGMEFNMYRSSLSGSLKAAIDVRDGCNDCYEVVGLKDADGNFLKDADGKVVDVQDLTETEYEQYKAQGYTKELTVYVDQYRNSDYKGVPYYQSQLNEFVRAITSEFNAIIAKGDRNGEPPIDFFTSKYGEEYISAAGVTVNPDIIRDISLLPYSFDDAQGAANSDMADALYALKEKDTINNGTFLEYLQSMVSVAYIDTARAKTFASNYNNIKDTINNQRLSIGGVDEDEEAVDMVKFKEAYSLASKVVSVMQEIYDKLIQETGV